MTPGQELERDLQGWIESRKEANPEFQLIEEEVALMIDPSAPDGTAAEAFLEEVIRENANSELGDLARLKLRELLTGGAPSQSRAEKARALIEEVYLNEAERRVLKLLNEGGYYSPEKWKDFEKFLNHTSQGIALSNAYKRMEKNDKIILLKQITFLAVHEKLEKQFNEAEGIDREFLGAQFSLASGNFDEAKNKFHKFYEENKRNTDEKVKDMCNVAKHHLRRFTYAAIKEMRTMRIKIKLQRGRRLLAIGLAGRSEQDWNLELFKNLMDEFDKILGQEKGIYTLEQLIAYLKTDSARKSLLELFLENPQFAAILHLKANSDPKKKDRLLLEVARQWYTYGGSYEICRESYDEILEQKIRKANQEVDKERLRKIAADNQLEIHKRVAAKAKAEGIDPETLTEKQKHTMAMFVENKIYQELLRKEQYRIMHTQKESFTEIELIALEEATEMDDLLDETFNLSAETWDRIIDQAWVIGWDILLVIVSGYSGGAFKKLAVEALKQVLIEKGIEASTQAAILTYVVGAAIDATGYELTNRTIRGLALLGGGEYDDAIGLFEPEELAIGIGTSALISGSTDVLLDVGVGAAKGLGIKAFAQNLKAAKSPVKTTIDTGIFTLLNALYE